jgi:hypothetical protein
MVISAIRANRLARCHKKIQRLAQNRGDDIRQMVAKAFGIG